MHQHSDFNEKKWYRTIYDNWERVSDIDELIVQDKKTWKDYLAVANYASDEEAFLLCELEKLPDRGRKMSCLHDWEEIDLIVYCTHWHLRGHINDPYNEHWINPESGIKEMAIGWYAWGWLMPNTKPALNTYELFNDYFIRVIKAEQQQSPGVRTYNMGHFCVNDWKDKEWNRQNNIEECKLWLQHERCMWLKVYPGLEGEWSVTTWFWWSETYQCTAEEWSTLDLAAQACLETDKTLTVHCETPWLSQNTWEAERDYIKNVILPLAKRYPKLKLVVAHVTLKSTVLDVIRANMMFWSNIHMEFTADHLFSNKDDIKNIAKRMDKLDPELQWKWAWLWECFPQVRWNEDVENLTLEWWDENRDFLWRCMKMATRTPYFKILLWTDHAPHPKENKLKENPSRWISSYKDSLRIYAEIAKQNWITVEQFKQFTSGNAIELHSFLKNLYDNDDLRETTLIHKGPIQMNPSERKRREEKAITSLYYLVNEIPRYYERKDFELYHGRLDNWKKLTTFPSELEHVIQELEYYLDDFNNTRLMIKECDTYKDWKYIHQEYMPIDPVKKIKRLRELQELMAWVNITNELIWKDNELIRRNFLEITYYINLIGSFEKKLEKNNTLELSHYDWNVLSPYWSEYVNFTIEK